jgi:predicted transcriptional regulator
MMNDTTRTLELTTSIVSAYVSRNPTQAAGLPDLIKAIHASLRSAGALQPPSSAVELRAIEPAVPIKKSITPDFLICLDDGKKFKSLKRHLRTAYNLSPDEYRAKWGLPSDYPMVAPAYGASRAAIAKKMRLGRNRHVHAAGNA